MIVEGLCAIAAFCIFGVYAGIYRLMRLHQIPATSSFLFVPLVLVITLIAFAQVLRELLQEQRAPISKLAVFFFCEFPMILDAACALLADYLIKLKTTQPSAIRQYRSVSNRRNAFVTTIKESTDSRLFAA